MADLPRLIRPMMAALAHELPASADRYRWELKWDWVRAVACLHGGQSGCCPATTRT